MFPQGMIWLCSIAEMYNRMLINMMVVNEFNVLSVDLALASLIFHRFYKVLESGIRTVAEHHLTNGFLDLLETFGRPGEPPGPVPVWEHSKTPSGFSHKIK